VAKVLMEEKDAWHLLDSSLGFFASFFMMKSLKDKCDG